MPRDPEQLAHLEWLGYVQPVGLVVSIPALLAAQAHVNRNIAPPHQRFLACLPRDKSEQVIPEIRDFADFTQAVLGWEPGDLVELSVVGCQLSETLRAFEVVLPEYHETLRPSYVVRDAVQTDGWHDLVELSVDSSQLSEKTGPRCEFLLDYEDDEEEEPTTDNRQLRTRKKPWRYRWPDEFRDEVLARLLELNKQRAEQERLAGIAAEAASKRPAGGTKKAPKPKRGPDTSPTQERLPGV